MVSRFKYTHVANRFLKGRKPADYLTAAIFGAVLVALFPEVCAVVGFCGFALTGPAVAFYGWMKGPQPVPPAEAAEAAEAPSEDEIPVADTPVADAPGADPATPEGQASAEPA